MTSAIDGHEDAVLPLRLVEPVARDAIVGSPTVQREFTGIPTGRSSFEALLRQGLVGYVLVLLGTALTAVAVQMTTLSVVLLVHAVLAWLGFTLAALPAYERAGSLRPATRLATVLAAGSLVMVVADSMTPETRRLAMVLSVTTVLMACSALAHRVILRRVPTLLVGPADAVNRLAARWDDRPDLVVVGRCTWDSHDPVGSATVNSVVRDVPKLLRTVRGARVVITADQALSDPSLRHLAWGLQRAEIECLVLTDMNDYVEFVRPTRVGDQLALALDPPNGHLVSQAIKAFFDRAVAATLLLLGAPLMAIIALAIKFDSRGPVIFRQERTGKDGVPFVIYKFRTMGVDAEERFEELRELNEGAGPLFKMTSDPRITRAGRVLRQTSLDELPQLFNVLLGDMALVGPRPALESETSQYSQWVWRRLHVKPGMTGLWQVSGRSTLSWDESIRLDLMYVNNWNLRMDLSIMLRTIGVVLGRKGGLVTSGIGVGYASGVFDMFHIGHLNLLRRSREHCDTLVVGVASDEYVMALKGKVPVVPLAERLEIVRALRFVDEVIVDQSEDKRVAWRERNFDAIFKGDDWRGSPKGDRLETAMAEVGAKVLYFPYTLHTSSSRLRGFIERSEAESYGS